MEAMELEQLFDDIKKEIKFLKTERSKCFSYMSRDRFECYYKNDRMKYLGFEPKRWYRCTDIVSVINARLRAIEDSKDLLNIYREILSAKNQVGYLKMERSALVMKREKTLGLMEQCMRINNEHAKPVIVSEFAKEIFGKNIGTAVSPDEAINKICQKIVDLDNEIEHYDSLIVEAEAELYCKGDITESEQEKIIMEPDGYYHYIDTDTAVEALNKYILGVMAELASENDDE